MMMRMMVMVVVVMVMILHDNDRGDSLGDGMMMPMVIGVVMMMVILKRFFFRYKLWHYTGALLQEVRTGEIWQVRGNINSWGGWGVILPCEKIREACHSFQGSTFQGACQQRTCLLWLAPVFLLPRFQSSGARRVLLLVPKWFSATGRLVSGVSLLLFRAALVSYKDKIFRRTRLERHPCACTEGTAHKHVKHELEQYYPLGPHARSIITYIFSKLLPF